MCQEEEVLTYGYVMWLAQCAGRAVIMLLCAFLALGCWSLQIGPSLRADELGALALGSLRLLANGLLNVGAQEAGLHCRCWAREGELQTAWCCLSGQRWPSYVLCS